MSTLELKKKTPCLYTENRWQASSFALKVINEDCHAFRGQYDWLNEPNSLKFLRCFSKRSLILKISN